MGHIGLTPQSVNAFGGFKVQGKDEESAKKILEDAKSLEKAGVFAITLECVPHKLAQLITESIKIGAMGFIVKPFESNGMLDVIKKIAEPN